jgi:hypothetical protein
MMSQILRKTSNFIFRKTDYDTHAYYYYSSEIAGGMGKGALHWKENI